MYRTCTDPYFYTECKEFPAFRLDAAIKSKLAYVTPIFNGSQVEKYLWVKIPSMLLNQYTLVEIAEQGLDVESVCLVKYCRYFGGPWYRLDTEVLNWDPGYHIYRMNMINKATDDLVAIYFAYHLQDDSPEKPYDYMKRDLEDCSCGATSN